MATGLLETPRPSHGRRHANAKVHEATYPPAVAAQVLAELDRRGEFYTDQRLPSGQVSIAAGCPLPRIEGEANHGA